MRVKKITLHCYLIVICATILIISSSLNAKKAAIIIDYETNCNESACLILPSLSKIPGLIKFISLYLSFALALYQIWDSSPSGIIGGLFTSIAAVLDSLLGISVWFIIISLYALTAIRLKRRSSRNLLVFFGLEKKVDTVR